MNPNRDELYESSDVLNPLSWMVAIVIGPDAAQGAEAIVYHPNAVGGSHIVEALGVPGVMADPLPTWVPTGTFPHIVAPEGPVGEGAGRRAAADPAAEAHR